MSYQTPTASSNPQHHRNSASRVPRLQGSCQSLSYWSGLNEVPSFKDKKPPTTLRHLGDYSTLDGERECDDEHSDLMLAATQAKRKVCKAKKYLAGCILAHQSALLDVWHQRAQAANSRLLVAELSIGRLHMEWKKFGVSMTMARSDAESATTIGTSSSY
ncbi:hypothetical protein F4604DRAFT_1934738 [Suillus subluteus]|nr:hypothetical protein F4604DRAFT_1934738 [Suillus subluteus]